MKMQARKVEFMGSRAISVASAAQVSPVHIRSKFLTAHLAVCGLFDRRTILRRDAARQHPLLYGLVSTNLQRFRSPDGAVEQVDRALDCLYGFHGPQEYTSKTSNASASCSEASFTCHYTSNMDTFPARLKSRLDSLELSFERAGALLGVSWQSVQQWCNGKTLPRRNKEAHISNMLQCRREWLFYGQEPMAAHDTTKSKDVGLLTNLFAMQEQAKYGSDSPVWPFTSVSFERFAALSEKDKRFVESVLFDAVIRCEEAAPSKQQASGGR